ncbi:MAG: PQQ-dependent sugar dehydrogenase, partial [Planctomycetota bacterium]
MRILLICAALLPLHACGGSSGDAQPDSSEAQAAFVAADLQFPLQAPDPGGFGILRAFPKLTFLRPMLLTHPPDDSDRIFVVERAGSIRVFENNDAVEPGEVKTFLDIRSAVSSTTSEAGLLGMAFDPNYRDNGYFYLNYTRSGPFRTVVARYQVDPQDPNRADRSSVVELLKFNQPFSNHNAGMIAFGSDSMLYIATGDGGSGGDPFNNSQNLGNLLGKILRIDPQMRNGSLIPADNPFVDDPSARDEIWAYGLRNPWRFSFDRNTGALWCADVGQAQREEIDIITKKGNYGWRVFEGTR